MVTRRDVLIAGLGIGGGAGGALAYSENSNVREVVNKTVPSGGPDDPFNQSLGGGFDRIEFHRDSPATLYWEENHDMEGFGLRHSYDSSGADDLIREEAPPYSGPKQVSVIKSIRNATRNFPTNEFILVAYGNMTFNTDLDKINYRASLKIPEELYPYSDG